MVIWRITDGRPGHDNQSRGLVNALCRLEPGSCLDIAADQLKYAALHCLLRNFPPGRQLPDPDLIIGAGHKTHLPVLCAQRARGGKSVVLMRPGLPFRWFDFCLVPEHDRPRPGGNIIITRGAINTALPSGHHHDRLGLILIGGPSRHYHWDEQQLVKQIQMVLEHDRKITWQIGDSPRTPPSTSRALANLGYMNTTYHSCLVTGKDWVAEQLARAGQVWVSADSVSMVYESLTAGAKTGILSVPEKNAGKLARGINDLVTSGMVTLFPAWLKGGRLMVPPVALDEAARCARLLLQHAGRLQRGA